MPKATTMRPTAVVARSRRWAAERHTLLALWSRATMPAAPQLSSRRSALNGPSRWAAGLTGRTAAPMMMISPMAMAMKPTYLLLLN